jgi:hypothetical protein
MRTLVIAAGAGLAAAIAGALLMWSIIELDHGQLRASVRAAFADGALVDRSGPLLDLHRGDYLFNDCLVLQTLLLGRDDWRHSVIDAQIFLSDDPCRLLEQEVTEPAQPRATYQYSRYLFSARVAAAPWLALLGVDRTKQLLRIAVYVTLVLTVLVCATRLLSAHAGRILPPRTLYLTGMLCALAMLGLYRLEYYAQTLAHGFSEWVIAAFLLYSVTLGGRGQEAGTPAAAIVLGVLTGCFELLTGPILVAAGMAVLLEHGETPTRSQPYRRAVLVGAACIAGMLLTMFWQQTIIAVFSDARPFHQFATHLAMRLQLHQFFTIPFDPQWATAANLHIYSRRDVADAVAAALPLLTHGSATAAKAVFGAAAVAIVIALALARPVARPGCVIAAAVASSVPVWYFAFANHTVLHSLYMIRMAMLVPLCGCVALMFAAVPTSWLAAPTADPGGDAATKAGIAGEKRPRDQGE